MTAAVTAVMKAAAMVTATEGGRVNKLPTLTVFTPTYNRADKLKRVYESLKRQTDKDFCWLIVDDGSADDTVGAVASMKEEKIVDITMIHRENGGKMRAHNTGVTACDTELFLCLDSDDWLTDTAVRDILDAWQDIRGRDEYAGIIAYKGEKMAAAAAEAGGGRMSENCDSKIDDHNIVWSSKKSHQDIERSTGMERVFGQSGGGTESGYPTGGQDIVPIYGNTFPDTGDSSFRELYQKGFKGETTLVFRTGLLKDNLFPEIEGEKYVPEDVVYDRIDEGHIFKVMPEILTVCELIDEGYTDRVEELRREAPTGWYIYYYQRALSWPFSLIKYKFAAHYLRFRQMVDISYKRAYRLPLHIVLCGIPGYIALCLKNKL